MTEDRKGENNMQKQIKIFDTTLRDGEQSPGCSMNLAEKIEMARAMKNKDYSVEEISELTGLSGEEIEKL